MEFNFNVRSSKDFGEWLATKQQKYLKEDGEPELKEVEQVFPDSEPKFDFGGILKEWIWVQTKITITIMGDRGVGKAFLANTLLSTTFLQDVANTPPASLPDEPRLDEPCQDMFMEDDKDCQPTSSIKEYLLDDSFAKQVNWASETEIIRNLQQYYTSAAFDSTTYDRHSWVLPQGAFVGVFNPKVYTLSFSKCATVKIYFLEESELRSELWQVHDKKFLLTDLGAHYKAKYRHILGVPRADPVPLSDLSSPKQLPISEEYLSLCGKCIVFKGTAKDPNLDRVYIREKLLETIAMYGPMILKVDLQLPCSILSGNTEFCIIDSTVPEPPIATIQRKILDATNFLVVAVGSQGISQPTCKVLQSSGYLDKFCKNSEDCKIGFVNVAEREEVSSISNAQIMFSFKSNEQNSFIKVQLINTLKQIIVSSESFSVGNFQMVEKAFNSVHLFTVKPLLFLSLSLNLNTKLFGETTLFEVRNKTNMPALMAAIQNIPLSKNFGSLQVMNQKVSELDAPMKRNRNFDENSELFSKVVDFFTTKKRKPRKWEKMIDRFHNKLKTFTTKLKEIETLIESHVGTKLLETMAKMGYYSSQKQHQEAILESYFESCNTQFTGLVLSAVKSCLERALKAGEEAIDRVVQALESSWGENMPEKERDRFRQTAQLCSSSMKKVVMLRMGTFKDQVNLLKHLSLKAMAQHFIQQENARVMLENSAKFLLKIYFETLLFGYQQIELLEKHADETFKCLIHSPVMKPALVMNFLISSQLKPSQIPKPEIPAQFLDVPVADPVPKSNQSKLSFLPKDFPEPVIFSEKNSLPKVDKSLQRFKLQLSLLSLEATMVTLDGNSQYRAISRLLYATENAHYVVRLLLMNEMLSNPDRYTKMLPSFRAKDINEYVLAHSREYQEGEFLTLQACANYAQSNVLLLSPLFGKPILFQCQNSAELSDAPTLFLALSDQRRFFPLVPTIIIDIKDPNPSPPGPSPLLTPKTVAVQVPGTKPSKLEIFTESESSADDQLKKNFAFLNISDENASGASSTSASESPAPRKKNKSSSLRRSSGSEREGNPFSRHSKTMSLEKPFLVPEKPSLNTSTGSHAVHVPEKPLARIPFVKTLKQFALDSIVKNLNMYSNLHNLPDELLHEIIRILSDQNLLQDGTLAKLLDPNLTNLDFSDCRTLSGQTLSLVSKICKNLSSISFKGCSTLTIQDALILAQSETAKNLEILNMEECVLIEDANVIGFAKNSPNLRALNVSECRKLTDMSLKYVFQTCKGLTDLKVKNVSSISEKSLMSLPASMKSVNALGCPHVSSRFIEYASLNFGNISEICVPGSAITDISLKVLCQHGKNLEKLRIPGVPEISRTLVNNFLKSFPNLQILDLTGSKMTADDLFLPLAEIPSDENPLASLEKVKLGSIPVVSPSKVFAVFRQHLKNVTYIDISNWETVPDEDLDLTFHPQYMPHLNTLILAYCVKLTDLTAARIAARYGQQLERFNAMNCTMVGAEFLKSCGLHCQNLTEVHLGSSETITDDSVEAMSRGCRFLQKIILEECKITDRAILAIAQYCCGSLNTISLSLCSLLTITTVRHLVKHVNSSLKHLDLSYCTGINLDTLLTENFSKSHCQFPNLVSLRLKGFVTMKNQVIFHPRLQVLNVCWCKNLDNQFVNNCASNLPQLEKAYLSWCGNITTPSVQQWIQKSNMLKYLYLKGCSQIAFKSLIPLVGQIRQTRNRIMIVEY